MRKTILLKEDQLKQLLEVRINEVSTEEIANTLQSIDCTGEDLKKLMTRKLESFGFEMIKIVFLGKNERKDLMYIIYTEGPMFVTKARSEGDDDSPCLNVYEVDGYTKN